ncbi:helix-turn-helix domain-containing protein [Ekhidna sp.]|uniref:helix-turn-helix domain-containing protein n=1 Tax=Ekhidna sp. TaxID=2608089 RepID=UPI003CCC0E84
MSQSTDKYKNSVRHQLMQGFDQRIKRAMSLRSMTQLRLSDLISVSQPEISYYCRGKAYPRLGVIQQLSFHLNVSYLWLKFDQGDLYTTKEDLIKSFHSSFPEKLVWLLWNNKITPLQLSKDLNLSSTTVTYWCEGDRVPNNSTLGILTNYFNVELEWLIQGLDKFISLSEATKFNIDELRYIQYLKQELNYDDLIN